MKSIKCKLGFHKYYIIEELGHDGCVKVKCSRCPKEAYGYRAFHDDIMCKDGKHIVVDFWRNDFDDDTPVQKLLSPAERLK